MVDIQRVLSDVPEPSMAFWFNNGVVTKNIYELQKAVEGLDTKTFRYHVNSEKNDLYNWVAGVLGDEDLAEKLKEEKSKVKCTSKIKKRIKELEKLKKVAVAVS
jgi:hypothetical protein